jgi:MYXO-CTERM domain-containing protein
LSDGEEVQEHGTDPLDSDSDDGGVPDGEEVDNGTDPMDGSDDIASSDTAAAGGDTGLDGDPSKDEGSCGGCASQGAAPQRGWLVFGLLIGLLRRRK